jgi:HlyD family secretion protein
MQLPLVGKVNRPLFWILGFMAGGAVVIGIATYKLVETPSPQLEIEKLTVRAQREAVAVEIKASGTVEPIQSVNISPKNPGRLTKLLVEQGMAVKQGQPLAVMDNLETRAQGLAAEAKFKEALANLKAAEVRIPAEIKQAQTRLVQAQARLKESRARLPQQIRQAQSQVQAAEVRLQLAESRRQRNQALVKEGAITYDAFDAVQNEYLDAQAKRNESLQRLEEVKRAETPEITQLEAAVVESKLALQQRQEMAGSEIGQLQAAAAAAEAELERIKIQYRDTIVTAPFTGVITQKYATEGAFVTPTTSASSTASATSTSILALARGLEIIAKVPEVDISLLQRGQPVKVIADAYPNEAFQGQIIRIAPEAIVEQNVTSFEVTIGLITGQEKLRSKMNVDVTFMAQPLSDALVIPTVAIVTEKGETGVMVPDADNKPKFKSVRIGLVLDDKTQILEGLSPGERVFIDLPEEKKSQDNK